MGNVEYLYNHLLMNDLSRREHMRENEGIWPNLVANETLCQLSYDPNPLISS
jgi:hypothetical protein